MKEIKLNNGQEVVYSFTTKSKLPVYIWTNKDKTNVHLSLVVKYGSIGTTFKVNNINYSVPTGTAHYLEHIKFHLKDGDVSGRFYDLGCDSNAYTSLKETCYEVYANENIDDATRLLLDFVYDNYFTKKMIENERGIILEECNSNKDDPDYEFYIKTLQNYFVKSNFRNPVIGYENDIKSITVDDVSMIHEFFYRPENMFFVITGNVDPEHMKKIICENEHERVFKDIGKVEIINPKEPSSFNEKNMVIENKNVINKQGKYSIKIPEKVFKGYKKGEILVALRTLIFINFSPISNFYEYIIQNNHAVKFGSNVSYDDGIYGINFNILSDNPEEVFKFIDEQLHNMKITTDDIKREIKNSRASSIIRYDNIYSVSSYIIGSIIDDNELSDSRINYLKNLTVKKVKDIYSRIDLNNKMTAVLIPSKKKKN